MTSSSSLAGEITAHLSSKSLRPTQAWLNTFLSSQRSTTPLPALKQTALFRILQSDLTESVECFESSSLPSDISNGEIKARSVFGPIPVQILDIEDVGSSRWSQIEAIEAAERGETTKGREIIRVVPGEGTNPEQDLPATSGPFKLLVQDAKGNRAYAFGLHHIEGIGINTSIGSKMLLRNLSVARGVILLGLDNVTLLGGKIDSLQQTWRTGRKARLKAYLNTASE